jgi:hypothetical protein
MSEEFDLDAALQKSFDEIQSRGADEGVPSTVATPSAETTAVVEPPAPDAGKSRGPDGKFVKAEGIAEQTPVGQTPTESQVSDQTVTPGIRPPDSWSADAKTAFDALPLSVKEAIAKREMEVGRGFDQYREKSKGYESFEKVFAPVSAALQHHGMSREQYVSNLIAAEDRLNKNPVEGIKWLAQSYGIDLSNLTSGQPSANPEIDNLRQQVTDLSSWRQQSEQARQTAIQTELQNEIQKFSSDPAHEFYEQVKVDMGQIMLAAHQAGQTLTLKQAYDKAVRVNDAVYSIVEARRLDALSKKQADSAASKAKDAVRAAGVAVRGGGQAPVVLPTWEETLEAKSKSLAS